MSYGQTLLEASKFLMHATGAASKVALNGVGMVKKLGVQTQCWRMVIDQELRGS